MLLLPGSSSCCAATLLGNFTLVSAESGLSSWLQLNAASGAPLRSGDQSAGDSHPQRGTEGTGQAGGTAQWNPVGINQLVATRGQHFSKKNMGTKMKDTKLPDCFSSLWRFCLQVDLKAFCIYINRAAIWAEYWSVSNEGVRGQYQIIKSRDYTATLACMCLSHQKERQMHPHPCLPPFSPVETIHLRMGKS